MSNISLFFSYCFSQGFPKVFWPPGPWAPGPLGSCKTFKNNENSKKTLRTIQNTSKQWGTFISHFRQYVSLSSQTWGREPPRGAATSFRYSQCRATSATATSTDPAITAATLTATANNSPATSTQGPIGRWTSPMYIRSSDMFTTSC